MRVRMRMRVRRVVVGVRLDVAMGIALLALGVQAIALFLLASRGR